jgi:hypothetical protein
MPGARSLGKSTGSLDSDLSRFCGSGRCCPLLLFPEVIAIIMWEASTRRERGTSCLQIDIAEGVQMGAV